MIFFTKEEVLNLIKTHQVLIDYTILKDDRLHYITFIFYKNDIRYGILIDYDVALALLIYDKEQYGTIRSGSLKHYGKCLPKDDYLRLETMINLMFN